MAKRTRGSKRTSTQQKELDLIESADEKKLKEIIINEAKKIARSETSSARMLVEATKNLLRHEEESKKPNKSSNTSDQEESE